MAKKKQARPRKPATVKPGAAGQPAADADPSKITPVQKRTLVAFSWCGSISRAVKVAGSCQATHYKALKHSPRYRVAFEQAQETFADLLREAAHHRAIKGVPRLKFYMGQVIKAPVLNKEGRSALDDKGQPIL